MIIERKPTMIQKRYMYVFYDVNQKKPRCGCLHATCTEEARKTVKIYFPQAGKILIDELPDNAAVDHRIMERIRGNDIYNKIAELLEKRVIWLQDVDKPEKQQNGQGEKIGWRDEKYLYILPHMLYQQIRAAYQNSGMNYPTTMKELYKRLKEDNIILEQEGNVTRNKWIDGHAVRLLWIPYEQREM